MRHDLRGEKSANTMENNEIVHSSLIRMNMPNRSVYLCRDFPQKQIMLLLAAILHS